MIRNIFRNIFRYKLISVFFIVSQLVMFYSVFGGLSIYNKAYAKEQDRLKSLYKNRIEMEVVTGNGRNVVEHVDSGLSEGNLIIAGKLSLYYAQINANTRCEVIIKYNEDIPYQMISGRLPGSEKSDNGKRLIAVGKYKYKDAYEKNGKKYVTIENEEYEVCGVIGSDKSDCYDYKMVLNIKCLGENARNVINNKGNYTVELLGNNGSLNESYATVFGNIKSADNAAQISSKTIDSKKESDMVDDLSGENMKINIIVYVFCIFNCLLMSEFWLLQRRKEIAIKKVYGMSNLRILMGMAGNIGALCIVSLCIFILSAFIINMAKTDMYLIEINIMTLCTALIEIAVVIVLSMIYPLFKLLR